MSDVPEPAGESVAQVVANLSRRFPDVAEPVIVAHVERAYAGHTEAVVRAYLPVLVERQVRTALADLATAGEAA